MFRPNPVRKRRPKSKPLSKHDLTPPMRPSRKRALLVSILTRDAEAERKKADAMREQNPDAVIEGFVPHRDIRAMKKLIIEKYGYMEDDIVMMLDHEQGCEGSDPMLRPTHLNLIRELKNLVRDAQAGDRFFFHYSGHAIQKPCKKQTEEDGMDEYIVPCDDDEENTKAIKDNLLRNILVDSLPVGASLVAVFDSCNSGSLLDLPHHRCNRVYVPWLSKGKRHSATIRNGLARQGAIISEGSPLPTTSSSTDDTTIVIEPSPVTIVNVMRSRTRTIYSNRRTNPTSVHSRKTTMSIDRKHLPLPHEQFKLAGRATMPEISLSKPKSRRSGHGMLSFAIKAQTGLEYKATTKSRTMSLKSSVRLETTNVPSTSVDGVQAVIGVPQPRLTEDASLFVAEDTTVTIQGPASFIADPVVVPIVPTWFPSDEPPDTAGFSILRCESPSRQFECDGWCRNREKGQHFGHDVSYIESEGTTVNGEEEKEKADVMSMSASRDDQTAWEDPAYRSLTNILVEVLSEDSNPSLHQLMVDVSHKVHKIARTMHHSVRRYRRDVKEYQRKNPTTEFVYQGGSDTSNFQNPELGSHVSLDMQRRWDL